MLTNLMNARITVQRATFAPDSSGGVTQTFTTVYNDLPCSVQPARTDYRLLFAQRQIEVTHAIFIEGDVDIRKNDQVTFSTRKFIVVGKRDLVEMGIVSVVDCREVL